MHDDRQMLHSDLKSPNLMLGSDGVKMIDFGTAFLGSERNLGKRLVDNPIFLAPEQSGDGVTHATTKSDIWSIGTLAYELLVGPQKEHPTFSSGFMADIFDQLKEHNQNVDSRLMSHSPEGVPSESRKPIHELIDSMLMPLPEQRPEARDLLKTPLFQDERLGSEQMKSILGRLSEPLPQGTTDGDKAQVRFERVREDLEQLARVLVL